MICSTCRSVLNTTGQDYHIELDYSCTPEGFREWFENYIIEISAGENRFCSNKCYVEFIFNEFQRRHLNHESTFRDGKLWGLLEPVRLKFNNQWDSSISENDQIMKFVDRHLLK